MNRSSVRLARVILPLLIIAGARSAHAQTTPPVTTPPAGGAGGGRGGAGRGGRGGRSVPIQTMTLSTTAFADGGMIPVRYAQPGHDVSPPLTWTGAPAGTMSFVLFVHDVDASTATATGVDDLLQWLVWNIPAAATGLPEGMPQGPQLPDSTRQIGTTGPFYRGPAAPSTGPIHHYLYEVYALDTTLDVPSVGAALAPTRTAVMAAMVGHIRGKGILVGQFRRAAP